jgi:protein SCO1/2
LLSVSFDPDDDAGFLRGFEESRHLDAQRWRIARADGATRALLLQRFGIVAVRDPFGGWRHNAALHVVDADGVLVSIVAIDEPADALRLAESLSAKAVAAR